MTDAQLVYDFHDPNAAGYLSPYLLSQQQSAAHSAMYELTIDAQQPSYVGDRKTVARFGDVRLMHALSKQPKNP